MELSVPSLGRRERERLARREAMLDAALAVFADKGFEGATVDEIAERAEFGKGTIYNYFPEGKDELYMTLFVERVAGGLRSVINASFPDGLDLTSPASVRSAFRSFIASLLREFREASGPLLMFMKEGHRTQISAEHRASFARHHAGIMEAVARPIERAVEAGALRPLPAHSLAHVLMGNVRGFLMSEVDADCDSSGALPPAPFGSPDEAAEFLTTVLFDGLLAPGARPPSDA